MSKADFDKLYPSLKPTSMTLKTYSGEKVKPIGSMISKVQLNGQTKVSDLSVVSNGSRPLLGREWLNCFKLDWSSIKALEVQRADKKKGKIPKGEICISFQR